MKRPREEAATIRRKLREAAAAYDRLAKAVAGDERTLNLVRSYREELSSALVHARLLPIILRQAASQRSDEEKPELRALLELARKMIGEVTRR